MNPRLFGQQAAIRGAAASANPYQRGTQAHVDWLRGHSEIASDKREVRA